MAMTYKIGYFLPVLQQLSFLATENFDKQIFGGIKTLCYLEYFSKHSVCSGYNSHKALLVLININLPQKLFCSGFLVMVPINNGCFLIQKFSVDFQSFRVFAFCHRAYPKVRKPQIVLISSFLKFPGFCFLPQRIFKSVETTKF